MMDGMRSNQDLDALGESWKGTKKSNPATWI